MPLTPDQMDKIHLILYSIGCVSILGNVSLLVCVFRIKRFHKVISYMQACLATLEILQSSIYIIGPDTSHPTFCTIVGTLAQFIFNAITFWNFLISLYCYITIIYPPKSRRQPLALLPPLRVGSLPSFMVILLYTVAALDNRGSPDLRVDLFYIPLWIHFFILIPLYTHSQASHGITLDTDRGKSPPVPDLLSNEFLSVQDDEDQKATILQVAATSNRESLTALSLTPSMGTTSNTLSPAAAAASHPFSHFHFENQPSTTVKKRHHKSIHIKLILRASLLTLGFIYSWIPPSISRVLAILPQSSQHGTTFSSGQPFWFSVWVAAAFFITWFWDDIVKWVSNK
ncbi:hypothetical protein BDR26DRAFT_871081 [Obelidium mucronatum]|nr:hypothetical protein BDR26DRAFT_871081 [Obelidium mucronatum]